MANSQSEVADLVQRAVDQLGEHCDSVQIFITRHNPEGVKGTHTCAMGVGNWYSRYGQVKEWVLKEEEGVREEVRRERDS